MIFPGAKSEIRNFTKLSIVASILIAGCSEKPQNDEVLDTMQARAIIAWYFEDVKFDHSVQADVYPKSRAKVDVLGRYDGKWIAVRYGEEYLEMGAPQISPTIDYYLDIPEGNREFIQIMMQSLKKAKFTPVLSLSEELGVMKPLSQVKSMLEVRRADAGECRVVDAYLNCSGAFGLKPEGKNIFQMPLNKKFKIEGGEYCASTFSLESIGDDRFQMPPNKGFGLKEGNYTLLCDFSAEDGSRSEDVESATFEVPHCQGPVYKGGLEDATCEMGHEITLDALFVDAKGNEVEPVYYDEFGKRMDSNVFDCFGIGIYTIKAIATDEYGVQSESHEANIYVISFGEGLFPSDMNGSPLKSTHY